MAAARRSRVALGCTSYVSNPLVSFGPCERSPTGSPRLCASTAVTAIPTTSRVPSTSTRRRPEIARTGIGLAARRHSNRPRRLYAYAIGDAMTHRLVVLIALLALTSGEARAQTPPEWANPAVFTVGTERPHATFVVFPDAALASTGDATKSPFLASLNGPWKFHLSPRPDRRPVDFFRPTFDDGAWKTIPVPSNWQMQGFDLPIYTNIIYPWPQDPKAPPHVPDRRQPGRIATARSSPCRRPGRAGRCSCTSTASIPRSTSGSTARRSATARTAARPPSSTSRRT